ncbi:MAG: hypothetical protein AAFQ07_13185 [Chloroflexota bacterium]
MIIVLCVGVLLALLVLNDRFSSQPESDIDNGALHDPVLAYHLDWDAVRDRKFRQYLQVKKVNAVVRYQHITGVNYEQACDAVDYLLAEQTRKRRPTLPPADDAHIQALVAENRITDAVTRYAEVADVDIFTAEDAVSELRVLSDMR